MHRQSATPAGSAGGYLALMLGVTSGSADHEGTPGEHLDHSSSVEAVTAHQALLGAGAGADSTLMLIAGANHEDPAFHGPASPRRGHGVLPGASVMSSRAAMTTRFGIFDHIEDIPGTPTSRLFKDRLDLIRMADEAGFAGYHLAEHHGSDLCMAPSQELFIAADPR